MSSNNPFMPQPTGSNAPLPSGGNNMPDNFSIDLTDVQSNGFTIPDGNYKIKCIDIEQSVSKSGNPMFVWTFETVDGNNIGFQTKMFTAITPAAMWKVAEIVMALGIGQTGSVVNFKRSDVINKECGAFIEQTEYNGNIRSQISRIMSLKELAESRA